MLKKTLIATLLTLTMMATFSAHAENTNAPAVVNKSTCGKLTNKNVPFILVLQPGDSLRDTISQCAKDAKLTGASVSAIGQLHNPTLAYFTSRPTDKPTLKRFQGYYELASMQGNVSANDDKYYTHIHGVLADKEFHGIAGHIDAAETGLTVEVTLIPMLNTVARTVDAKTGFGPLVQE